MILDLNKNIRKVIITVGISGSGKSSWIKTINSPYFTVISTDDIRRELTGDISKQINPKVIFNIGHDRIIDAFKAGKDVIFDATNVRSKDRKELLTHIKNNYNNDFSAFAKVFYVDPEICKKRVKNDINSGVDRSDVSEKSIERQYRRFVSQINQLESDGFTIIN